MKNFVGCIATLMIILALAAPVRTAHAADACYRETGYCIDASIIGYWQTNGGLSVFGYPISGVTERTVDGNVIRTQHFERHRIEVHPVTAPYDIQLGRVGAEELQARYGVENQSDSRGMQSGCRWFSETQHAVCGELLDFWQGHGVSLDYRSGWSFEENLALLGYPLSGEVTEIIDGNAVTVQYFERGRLELHPENNLPYRVLSGLLGRSALQHTQTPVAEPVGEPEAEPVAVPVVNLLPDSVLATFIEYRMPTDGYWQASEHGIYSAVTNIRYLRTFSSFNAPRGQRFVSMSVQYRNDRQPNLATEYCGPELYTLIDLKDGEHPLDFRYVALRGYMHGAMVDPGQRTGGQLLFLIDSDTAPKQLRVQTNAGIVTIELRVWPIVP